MLAPKRSWLFAALVAGATLWGAPAAAQPSAQFLTGHAEPDFVTLTWVVEGEVDRVSVDRRTGDGPWQSIDDTVATAAGVVHIEDRGVAPVARYGRRAARPGRPEWAG